MKLSLTSMSSLSSTLFRTLTLPLAAASLLACDYEQKVPGQQGPPTTPTADTVTPPDTSVPTPDTSSPTPDTSSPTPDTSTPTPDTTSPDTTLPDPWVHPVVVGVDEGTTEDAPLDPLAPVPEVAPRGRQRMNIEQVDKAFQTVLDGITWTLRVGNTDVNQFQVLSETLGVPDFIDTTVEDLAPTPLFTKFLNDAARKACSDRIAADLLLANQDPATTNGRRPVLFGTLSPDLTLATSPEAAAAIEAQISSLLLRFHGRTLSADKPGFSEWRWLFESSTQLTGTPSIAWQAMCVALITHPDFYTY